LSWPKEPCSDAYDQNQCECCDDDHRSRPHGHRCFCSGVSLRGRRYRAIICLTRIFSFSFFVHLLSPGSFGCRQPQRGEMFMEQRLTKDLLAPSGAKCSAAHKWADEIEMETETINISYLRHFSTLTIPLARYARGSVTFIALSAPAKPWLEKSLRARCKRQAPHQ
jgi:hypothetical protein